jgi:hypothetical protein
MKWVLVALSKLPQLRSLLADLEQHCPEVSRPTPTLAPQVREGQLLRNVKVTSGGYSDRLLWMNTFASRCRSISLEVVGPAPMCTYHHSPSEPSHSQRGGGKGKKVGVVGLEVLDTWPQACQGYGRLLAVLTLTKAKALSADIMVHSDPKVH